MITFYFKKENEEVIKFEVSAMKAYVANLVSCDINVNNIQIRCVCVFIVRYFKRLHTKLLHLW